MLNSQRKILIYIVCILFHHIILPSQKFSDPELTLLAQPRTTNLVIINDIFENAPKALLDPWLLKETELGASISTLIEALTTNQVVLCSQSLWITLQNIVQVFNDYTTKTEKELITACNQKLKSDEFQQLLIQRAEFDIAQLENPTDEDKDNITEEYQSILEINPKDIIPDIRNNMKMLHQKYSALKTTSDTMNISDEQFAEFENDEETFLMAFIAYKIIVASNFICKRVTPEFILFIPKTLIPQHLKPEIQDMFLGLSHTKFASFNYQTFLSEPEAQRVYQNALNIERQTSLGKKLLQALQILKIKKHMSSEKILLPFFNFSIQGHGEFTPKPMIAEISTAFSKPTNNQPATSDLMQLLKLLQHNFYTKSLSFSSCYPGGKHFTSMFDVKNQFNNPYLEQITYPIIFIGSFLATTFTAFESKIRLENLEFFTDQKIIGPKRPNIFVQYFNYINQTPPDYQHATNILSGIFDNDKLSDSPRLSNYASIKFPNVSWLTPSEMDTKTQRISQIEALIKKEIKIKDSVEIILLTANVIPATINCKPLPYFLPMNIHNQNYVIEKILIQNQSRSYKKFENIIEYILPISTIEEPINIAIKELKFENNYTYKNIYAFTYLNIQDIAQFVAEEYSIEDDYFKQPYSGYFYTNSSSGKDETFLVIWPTSKDKTDPESEDDLIITIDNTKPIQNIIDSVEKNAKSNLKTLQELEASIAKKQLRVIKFQKC